jgi:hypothetical protein
MTRATLAQASTWLLRLRATQNIAESALDAKLAVRPIAASMIKTYDADVFRPESREAVSATLKWFKEPDIRERLDVWVRINAPETVEMLHPDAAIAPISEAARWHFSRFLKASDETVAIRALGTLRSREGEAFDWIVRHDHMAASYAVQHGWKPTPMADELGTDWDDEPCIRDIVQKIVAGMRTQGTAQRVRHDQWRSLGDILWFGAKPRANITSDPSILIMTLARVIRLHAPQHQDILLDELRSVAEPVPVAFVETTLFGEI